MNSNQESDTSGFSSDDQDGSHIENEIDIQSDEEEEKEVVAEEDDGNHAWN